MAEIFFKFDSFKWSGVEGQLFSNLKVVVVHGLVCGRNQVCLKVELVSWVLGLPHVELAVGVASGDPTWVLEVWHELSLLCFHYLLQRLFLAYFSYLID